LNRKDGTKRVKEEYHYWIVWLNNEFKKQRRNTFWEENPGLLALIRRNKILNDDLRISKG
jgi:flagellar biosynthesis regulator FlbT